MTDDVSFVGLRSGTPGNVGDQIALRDAALRERVAMQIVSIFTQANVAVLILVGFMFTADCVLLLSGLIAAPDRLVSTNVLISLVTATTVQLGAIVILMGKYLFPAKA